jgi:dihydroorotate dehydrogenase (NAD+) catalytic subunit
MLDLTARIGTLTLHNPVLAASGTFGYGTELAEFVDLDQIGGVFTKGLSVEPRPGNPPPRLAETAAGMLNAIGLENVGLERFVAEKVPAFTGRKCAFIPNIFGASVEEFRTLAERLDPLPRVDALELNISCPNVKAGGVSFGRDPKLAAEVTRAVRRVAKKPVVVKLSPNVADIAEIGRAVEAEGADAVSVINTLTGMAIDLKTRRPLLGNATGGLSGPAIKPVAIRMVFECRRALKIPIVGIGGIMSGLDAAEFILAGACAVQVGTATFAEPGAVGRIARELAQWAAQQRVSSLGELVGAALQREVSSG